MEMNTEIDVVKKEGSGVQSTGVAGDLEWKGKQGLWLQVRAPQMERGGNEDIVFLIGRLMLGHYLG